MEELRIHGPAIQTVYQQLNMNKAVNYKSTFLMWDQGANHSHTKQHNRNHSPGLFLSPADEIQFFLNLNPSSSWGTFITGSFKV